MMTATFTMYADLLKGVQTGFQTAPYFVYYFDDTGGPSGNFYIWAVYWVAKDVMKIAVAGKPTTFATDFPNAIQLTGVMTLS